jgi:hypothetical protein
MHTTFYFVFKLIQCSIWRVDVQLTISHILVAADDGPMKAQNR